MATSEHEVKAGPKWADGISQRDKSHQSASEYAEIRDELSAWLEAAYEAWQIDPNGWRILEFDDADERAEAVTAAKWYLATREDGPLTFSVKNDTEPGVLIYRVRDKIVKARRSGATPHVDNGQGGINMPNTDGGSDDDASSAA